MIICFINGIDYEQYGIFLATERTILIESELQKL
jgi:hypothetical protein